MKHKVNKFWQFMPVHPSFEALAEQAERELDIPRDRYGQEDLQDLDGTHCQECDSPIYYIKAKVGYGPSLEICQLCKYFNTRMPK